MQIFLASLENHQVVETEKNNLIPYRQEIFRTIAERQNTTAEVVGRRFAARVAERARVGTLRQTAEGNWITVTGE